MTGNYMLALLSSSYNESLDSETPHKHDSGCYWATNKMERSNNTW